MNNSTLQKNWLAKALLVSPLFILFAVGLFCFAGKGESISFAAAGLEHPVVTTQLPLDTAAEQQGALADGTLRARFGEGGRLVLISPDASTRVLTEDFHSASDPTISFDGKQILFAAKKTATDSWDIFEMRVDGSNVRQVTDLEMDCRNPGYQSTFYTIVSSEPWYQLTFVGTQKDSVNEYGLGSVSHLYSCKVDGSALRQLTYNLSSDMDPFIFPDGRIVYASWQRALLDRGKAGRIILCGVNADGTDQSAFSADEGKRVKQMPCVTTDGLAIFVESEKVGWDGAGNLGSVTTRRPLHSYRPITQESEGLFHSPSPLKDGRIIVSRRPIDGSGSHGLYCLDPSNGDCELVFDNPEYHDIQAQLITSRKEPDGRSSVVKEEDPNGKFYCLDVYTNDLENPDWMPKGTVKKLRILEGIPLKQAAECADIPAIAKRRILGEVDVAADGSFNIEIPGSIPVQLQTLDENGLALQTCNWIWAKNHEPRGCIGCHEDGELTPENSLVDAIKRPSVPVTPPAEDRRSVDFRRDIMPILESKCVTCHGDSDSILRLTAESGIDSECNPAYKTLLEQGEDPAQGTYVYRHKARTSRLIWHILGQNTARPWDGELFNNNLPGDSEIVAAELSDEEKKAFIEWVDMGAVWDGIPD
ncbi:MAG: HzsA-related protein [Planctomycetota bacterium]